MLQECVAGTAMDSHGGSGCTCRWPNTTVCRGLQSCPIRNMSCIRDMRMGGVGALVGRSARVHVAVAFVIP